MRNKSNIIIKKKTVIKKKKDITKISFILTIFSLISQIKKFLMKRETKQYINCLDLK